MQVYCSVPLILRDKMIMGCQNLGRNEAPHHVTLLWKTQTPSSSRAVTSPAKEQPDLLQSSSVPWVKVIVIGMEVALSMPSRKIYFSILQIIALFSTPQIITAVEPSPIALQPTHPR